MMKQQRGMTFLGFLIVGAIVLSVVLVGIKITPDYIEFMSVKQIVQRLGNQPEFSQMGKKEIQDAFDKAASAGYVTVIKGSDLQITKDESGKQVVIAEYQVVRPIVFNISALMDFKASSAK
jgi:hypothetical protein